MAISSKKSALASALLVGALAFSGCGASNSADDAAASASAEQVTTDGIQTLVDDYTKAMTKEIDLDNLITALDEYEVLTPSESEEDDTLTSIEKVFDGLSADEQDEVKQLLEEQNPALKEVIDDSNLSKSEQLTLGVMNLSLSSGFSEVSSDMNLDDNQVDVNSLTLEGNKTTVPMKALQDAANTDSAKDFFGEVPAIYVDGSWKVDGEKYYSELKDVIG